VVVKVIEIVKCFVLNRCVSVNFTTYQQSDFVSNFLKNILLMISLGCFLSLLKYSW